MESTAPGPVVASVLEVIANLVIAAAVGSVTFILLVRSLRHLLWRVRRKLILSYILTGLLPIVLIAILFLVAGTLTLLAFSSYMVTLQASTNLVREVRAVAVAAAGELDAGPGGEAASRCWRATNAPWRRAE